jgi:hypothetical protein
MDVVVGSPPGLVLLRGTGDGLETTDRIEGGFSSYFVGDVDGDGRADVFASGHGPRMLFGGDAPLQEERQVRFAGHCGWVVGLADVDRDGLLDVVCTSGEAIGLDEAFDLQDGPAVRVNVMRGHGDGSFDEPYVAGIYAGCGASPVARVVQADVPGLVDVVVACWDREVALLRGDGSGRFEGVWVGGHGSASAVGAGDLDGDGRMDIVSTQCARKDGNCFESGKGALHVWLGSDDGVQDSAIELALGEAPIDLAVGDLDGDGLDDVVVADAASSALSILYSRDLTRLVVHPVENRVTAVSVADLDGDGDLDIVVSARTSEGLAIGVIDNPGDGTLGAHTYYSVHEEP